LNSNKTDERCGEKEMAKTESLKKGLTQELLTKGIGHKEVKDTEIGKIPKEWDFVRLEHLVKKDKFAIVDGPFGTQLHSNEYVEWGVPLIREDNINKNGSFNPNNLVYITEEKWEELKRSAVFPGDILLAKTGATIGKVCLFPDKFKKGLISSNCAKISTDPSKACNQYIFYFLLSNFGYSQILALANGSARSTINLTSISEIKIAIPKNIKEQQKIADILSDLDEKIELNNRMNKTLEDIAQAIFKRWFIDFEFPNENGEPYKSSGGEMVESELGMIPRKFKIGFLSEIAAVKSGRRPSEKNETKTEVFKYPLVGASSINGYVKEPLFYEPVIVIGRVGTHGVVQRFSSHSFPSDNTLVIISKFKEFSFQILKRINYAELNVGSTQPLITQTSISNIKIIIPPEQILTDFEDITKNLYKLTDLNNNLNESISKIRDLLLPKLMTGKIRVPLEELNVE